MKIILTTMVNYKEEDTQVFLASLIAQKYDGKLVIVGTKQNWPRLKHLDVTWLEPVKSHWHINSSRFLAYKKYLETIDAPANIILTDSRDVVFQLPVQSIAYQYLCSYTENQKLGCCPYNSEWMRIIGCTQYNHKPIICAGVTTGSTLAIRHYVAKLVEELMMYPKVKGLDQALHNKLFYGNKLVLSRVIGNIEGPVYTVGYYARETLIPTNVLSNQAGTPVIVHQYDRHKNLTKFFKEKYL